MLKKSASSLNSSWKGAKRERRGDENRWHTHQGTTVTRLLLRVGSSLQKSAGLKATRLKENYRYACLSSECIQVTWDVEKNWRKEQRRSIGKFLTFIVERTFEGKRQSQTHARVLQANFKWLSHDSPAMKIKQRIERIKTSGFQLKFGSSGFEGCF